MLIPRRAFLTGLGAFLVLVPSPAFAVTKKITDFAPGVGQGSQVQDDLALNAAIADANATGGNYLLLYPSGKYKHGNIATPILAPRVSIVGESKESTFLDLSASTGTFLQWGNPSLPTSSAGSEGSFERFTVDWGPNAPLGTIFARICNYHRVEFRNSFFAHFQTLAYLGESAAKTTSSIKYIGCRGFSANGGSAAFRIRFGTGLFLGSSCNFYVAVPTPSSSVPHATQPGTNLFRCDEGTWDSVHVDGGLYERFYIAFAVTAFPGQIYLNFFVNGAVFDLSRYSTVYLESKEGGVISGFGMNGGWSTCWEAHNAQIVGNGYNDNHAIANVEMPLTGVSQLSYANPSARANLFVNNRLSGDNRTGNSVAAVHMVSGSGLSVLGNVGTTNSPNGVYIAPGCSHYQTANNLP